MFRVRDYSLFLPSPNAERAFRKLRQLDYVVNGLIITLVLLSLWNIVQLVRLRMISNQDLGNVRSIADDPSSRLIWGLTVLTIAVIAVREWTLGERTLGLIYPLSALLAIVLVPAMMTEIQPVLRDHTLRVVMNECPPKAIVNGELSSIARCHPREIAAGDLLLATSNPAEGPFETLDPVSGGQNTIAYTMAGRGTYTVYFMFRFDDLASCQKGMIFHRGTSADAESLACVEHNGAAWMVLPHTTAANLPSGVHLVQVAVP